MLKGKTSKPCKYRVKSDKFHVKLWNCQKSWVLRLTWTIPHQFHPQLTWTKIKFPFFSPSYCAREYYTILYRNACTKYFPLLFCTTKLPKSTSNYYFVLQCLHKVPPSNTLCYKACTRHSPALLCTTKLAKVPLIIYYFVLQSLHKALPSTTVYYKASKKHLQVRLCTAMLAQSTPQYQFVLQSLHQSTSQYYFVLQGLHKELPSTIYFVLLQFLLGVVPSTLYYKSCTKYLPELLCTAMLAQRTSQY